MTRINLTPYATITNSNMGTCSELVACAYFGIIRVKQDNSNYMTHSDIELPDGRNISVKSNEATLMCGTLCRGCHTFEGIWRRYYRNVHSNLWLYVTKDWVAYLMDKQEFSKMVHHFGTLAHESSKAYHLPKIRLRPETKKMIQWLESQCA